MIDLVPASRRTAELIANIGDDKLASPTPFPDFTLGDLPDHENGLSQTFTDARLFPAGLLRRVVAERLGIVPDEIGRATASRSAARRSWGASSTATHAHQ